MNEHLRFYLIASLITNLVVLVFVFSAFSDETLEVAKVISAEACGEGLTGMHAVANTIQNRAKLYNKSYYKIVTAKSQYSGYTNKNKDKIFNGGNCREISLILARNLDTIKDITNGALYFKRPEEKRMPWHKVLTIIIVNHEFYK